MKTGSRILLTTISIFFFTATISAWEYDKSQFPKSTEQEIIKARENAAKVQTLRWEDPEGRLPITYSDWQAKRDTRNGAIVKAIDFGVKGKGPSFTIFVDIGYDGLLDDEMAVFVQDLFASGFDLVRYRVITAVNPVLIRDTLYDHYLSGMQGCLFIGSAAVQWFEMDNCFDYGENEQFPCDYYFMDLDGIWTDSDSDGMLDTHSGDMMPEIYVGRLDPTLMTLGSSTPDEMLRDYFHKNHEYRTGGYRANYRGLMFVDDDWQYSAEEWNSAMQQIYCATTLESDIYETIDDLYEAEVGQGYEFVQVCVHSGPWAHYFNAGVGSGGVTQNTEIFGMDAPGCFYNLFACSNCRYVESNSMGNCYIFTKDHGLGAVGSTKTGSMLNFEYFYGPLSLGANMGEAFRDWFAEIASWGWYFDNQCWFYGMTLLGDPTLKPYLERPPVTLDASHIKHAAKGIAYYSYFTAAGGGGTPPFNWQVYNGSIPTGTTLNPSTGEIVGVPQVAGDYNFTVSVSDYCSPQYTDTARICISVIENCGDVFPDGEINVIDIVYLVNYKFKGGMRPPVLGAADVNSDGNVDILDIVYLVNYKFKGGPDPYCFG